MPPCPRAGPVATVRLLGRIDFSPAVLPRFPPPSCRLNGNAHPSDGSFRRWRQAERRAGRRRPGRAGREPALIESDARGPNAGVLSLRSKSTEARACRDSFRRWRPCHSPSRFQQLPWMVPHSVRLSQPAPIRRAKRTRPLSFRPTTRPCRRSSSPPETWEITGAA